MEGERAGGGQWYEIVLRTVPLLCSAQGSWKQQQTSAATAENNLFDEQRSVRISLINLFVLERCCVCVHFICMLSS